MILKFNEFVDLGVATSLGMGLPKGEDIAQYIRTIMVSNFLNGYIQTKYPAVSVSYLYYQVNLCNNVYVHCSIRAISY